MCVRMRVCVYVCMCVCVRTCVRAGVYVCVRACVRACVCTCVVRVGGDNKVNQVCVESVRGLQSRIFSCKMNRLDIAILRTVKRS